LSIGVALVLAVAVGVLAGGHGSRPRPRSVRVEIDLGHPGAPVPRAFLGLSFELSSLPQIARYGSRGDLVALLRQLGPGVLRFGGGTADTRVAFTDADAPQPAWALYALHTSDLRLLRGLASRSGWRVLLTIGIAHFEPGRAAREAAVAKRALGPWLAGIELGNEPDAYGRHRLRSQPWTAARYDAQVSIYRREIARVAPGLPLAGPDLSGSRIFSRWGTAFADSQHPALLTGHHYPLGCHQQPQPSIARLLSHSIRAAEEHSLRLYMSVARASHTQFRLDETGSVSCGGMAGVSDTPASSLWAFDYIIHAMAAGVAGINFHGNLSNCRGYAPLCAPSSRDLASGMLSARPEWFALLKSRALIGDRPVHTSVDAGGADVDAVAFLDDRRRLHVAIVDEDHPGASHATVQLRVSSRGRLAASPPLEVSPSSAVIVTVVQDRHVVGVS
jgi:hypothetical protein